MHDWQEGLGEKPEPRKTAKAHFSPSFLFRGFGEGLDSTAYILVNSKRMRTVRVWMYMFWQFWTVVASKAVR